MKSCAGILLGLWSESPSCSFTEQLLFLQSCEWLLLIICLINKCGGGNFIFKLRGKCKATRLVKLNVLFFQMLVVCCTWRALSPERITVTL